MHRTGEPVEELKPVLDCEQIISLQEAVRQVTVEDSMHEYLLDIVDATRNSDELHVGVSTRGALCLYRASQSLALVEGRDFVVPDDIKRLAVPVLAHRVITKAICTADSVRQSKLSSNASSTKCLCPNENILTSKL